MANAGDNIPWMVAGNVQHSVDVARLVTYAAFNGEQGIIGPTDLEVRELATPGTSVQVYTGAGAVLASGLSYEAYAFRLSSNSEVAIPASGSAGDRYHLVVARIEDPSVQTKWTAPAAGSEQTYNYFNLAVIPDVSSTSKGAEIGSDAAIPLARIHVPANTATITQSMITDLRQLTAVRHEVTQSVIAPTTTENMSSSSYVNWPKAANMSIDVPAWATHLQVEAILGGISYGVSGGAGPYNVTGNIRVQLGLDTDSDVSYGQATAYNVHADSGIDRAVLMTGQPMMFIPKTKRGTTTEMRLEAQKTGGNDTLTSDTMSMIAMTVRFVQAPESNV